MNLDLSKFFEKENNNNMVTFLGHLLILFTAITVYATDSDSKSKSKSNNIRKVIIDTDGGVNDVFAIIWALEALTNNLIDIKALTTVKSDLSSYDAFRNVVHMVNITKRSQKKKKFLSIPIGKSANDDTINNNEDEEQQPSVDDGLFGFSVLFSQYPDIMNTPKKTKKAFKTASFSDDLLIETITKYPNQISLITTGPLTNLYLAEVKSPGIISQLKDIYILGGEFLNKTGNSKDYALSEYNFNFDSNALYQLFETLNNQQNGIMPNVFIFPLDSSNKMQFGLQHISLLYTLLNTDIQTEIEMCRMKMEKDADKYAGEEDFYDSDLYDSDRENDADDYDDFQCTQTGLLYIFYEKMMEEVLKINYLNGECDCVQIKDAAIIGYLLYPHLFDFKYVKCKVIKESGMIYYDQRLEIMKEDTIEIPNCFVNLDVNADKMVHAFARDSVSMLHGTYMDYMEYMMNNMDW